MTHMERIFQRLQENEHIQHKFHELEASIISILNFKDFFEKLLIEMMTIFHIPYVWMSVIAESHLAGLMNRINDSNVIRKRTNRITRHEFKAIIGEHSAPVLINEDLESYAAFFPDDMVCPIGSLAITPVKIDDEVVGSLNQWDVSPNRFAPDMDTAFLEQLTLKISLCLSNVAAHEKLRFFAYHDPLTGLLNRRAFEEALLREFSRSSRHRSSLSLIFMDLDAFKQINDTYGHDIGDIALKSVADALEINCRKEDIISRLAGDEFVAMLCETSEGAAEEFIMRVHEYLNSQPLKVKSRVIPISLSYGISSTTDPHISSPEQLLKTADERLYAAKKTRELSDPQRFLAEGRVVCRIAE